MVMPLRFNKCGFDVFSKMSNRRFMEEGVPVYLNAYDLTPMNGYVYRAGLGIFHSEVEVHGVECALGAHDYPTSGVFEVVPRQCPGFPFRKSVYIGSTTLNRSEFREFIEQPVGNYIGDTYHLIAKICNHFYNDICFKMRGKSIPRWVNRLAKIGSLCYCLLPEDLHVPVVRHESDYQALEGERKRLRMFLLSVVW